MINREEKTCFNCGYKMDGPCQYANACTSIDNKWKPIEGQVFHGTISADQIINGVARSETTTNNQGGKQSRLDYRFDLIDAKALFELARVMHEGAQKYERDNWRKIDTESHLNHAISHIYAYLAGDKQDDHLSHALCRCHMALAVSVRDNVRNCDLWTVGHAQE